MAHANDINHIQRVEDKSTVVKHSKNCVKEFAIVFIKRSNLLMSISCFNDEIAEWLSQVSID